MGELIPVDNAGRWREVLQQVGSFDAYHLPEYHLIECQENGGEAFLYAYESEETLFAVPLIRRRLPELPWLDEPCCDASSAYGYPGPLVVVGGGDLQTASEAAIADMRTTLAGVEIVSFFVRLHPVLTPDNLFGEHEKVIGPTVNLDLSAPLDQQRAACRKSHRYEYRKSLRAGVTATIDEDFSRLESFVGIYQERMKSLGASAFYFFSNDYYSRLVREMGSTLKLVHADYDGEAIASSMFFVRGSGIQYHLSGTKAGFERLSPTRVILERMREWGTERGLSWMHLGGGVGGATDSLYRFKSGFGPGRSAYKVGNIVVDEVRYDRLCQRRDAYCRQRGLGPAHDGFFPAYRASADQSGSVLLPAEDRRDTPRMET